MDDFQFDTIRRVCPIKSTRRFVMHCLLSVSLSVLMGHIWPAWYINSYSSGLYSLWLLHLGSELYNGANKNGAILKNIGNIERNLTHSGRVMHICVSKLTIIASENGVSPGRHQAIIWTNAEILLIGHLVKTIKWNLKHNLYIFMQEMHFKMSSGKWRPQCVNLKPHQRKYCMLIHGMYFIENNYIPLRWRHNGRDIVSNHQPHDCLLNRLFRRRSKKHQSSASLAFVRGIHR